MKQFNIGVRYDDEMLSILLYADDIILMAETEQDLQNMLLCAVNWCKRWRLMINQTDQPGRSTRQINQIMHCRKPGTKRSVFHFFGGVKTFLSLLAIINICVSLLMNILPFYDGTSALADSASRALGGVTEKREHSKTLVMLCIPNCIRHV